MARWNPGKHPRSPNGKFKGSGGGSSSGRSDRVTLVGKGKSLRFSRKPTRGEVTKTIASAVGRGAIIGAAAGPKGAAVGAVLVGGNTAAKVLVLSRRTAKRKR